MGNVLMRGIKLWQWCKNVHRWAYAKESATKIRPKELISLRTTHGISDLVHMCLYTNTSNAHLTSTHTYHAEHAKLRHRINTSGRTHTFFDTRQHMDQKKRKTYSRQSDANRGWLLEVLRHPRRAEDRARALYLVFGFVVWHEEVA